MSKMKVAFYDTKTYEREFYLDHPDIECHFFETRLDLRTAPLSRGFNAIAAFVNDKLDRDCLSQLQQNGVKLVCLRCAGFNNVDLPAAQDLGIQVTRVPGYSPSSVAEFTLLQMLSLTRKFHRAYQRTREFNFSLEGLVGETLADKTIGVVGTGQIGSALVKLLDGFHCRVLAYDLSPDQSLCQGRDLAFVEIETLLKKSHIVSLNVPLVPETKHLINQQSLEIMRAGAFLVNTGRGGLIDSKALIGALKSKRLAGAALDVYEEEEKYFFQDLSEVGIDDDDLVRLMSFPNVVITSHQAYLTKTSLEQISRSTIKSLQQFKRGERLSEEIKV